MKKKDIQNFLLGLAALLALNWLASYNFFRWDLTEEKRYTISEPTRNILGDLEGEVYVKIYLEGDLPAGFQRLKKGVQEMLDEFQIYAGKRLKYRFINPQTAYSNAEEQQAFYQYLFEQGITPTDIYDRRGDERVQKRIIPGAIISYVSDDGEQQYETSALLFKAIDQRVQSAMSPEQILNQSVENTEYNLISAIRRLVIKEKKKIGITLGHGELSNPQLATAITRLQEYYEVFRVPLPLEPQIKEGLDAIMVVKPDTAFSDEDKYKLDQFIMGGGKALFFVDVVSLHMDSVIRDKGAYTFPVEHNLLDMFFRYGVRVNPNLIKDLNAGLIPVVVGNLTSEQPNIQPIPWQYYPLINTFSRHPIVKNLGPVQSRFVSTIDTVKAEGILKTPLLFSSRYSQVRATPAYVSYEEERQRPDPAQYNQGPLPVAYLLEGEFTSMFKSRSFSQRSGFIAQSPYTRLLICSDGDLIRNRINSQTGEPIPLGLDEIRKTTFDNAEFLINAVDYMLDDKGIILAKNKDVVLRPLDKLRLQNEKQYWQIFNLGLPILFILLFGAVNFWIRQRRYTR